MSDRPRVVISTRLPPATCGIGTHSVALRNHWPGEAKPFEFLVLEGRRAGQSDRVTEFAGNASRLQQELERIGAAEELQMAPRGADGAPRPPLPIWVVRAGADLYVRSWRGTAGGWFRAVQASHAARVRAGGVERDVDLAEAGDEVNDAVDAAYRDKYGRYPSYVEPMVRPEARATTLRLVPAGDERA